MFLSLLFFPFLSLQLTMVVLRSLSLSPPRPDTTVSSRPGELVPTRNFPDKLRYSRRAALGEDRLADLRAGAGWWAWSPLMGCVILVESALEETQDSIVKMTFHAPKCYYWQLYLKKMTNDKNEENRFLLRSLSAERFSFRLCKPTLGLSVDLSTEELHDSHCTLLQDHI